MQSSSTRRLCDKRDEFVRNSTWVLDCWPYFLLLSRLGNAYHRRGEIISALHDLDSGIRGNDRARHDFLYSFSLLLDTTVTAACIFPFRRRSWVEQRSDCACGCVGVDTQSDLHPVFDADCWKAALLVKPTWRMQPLVGCCGRVRTCRA